MSLYSGCMEKTKRKIQNALLELAEKKNIEEITVKDICIKADIAKQTFYNNYRDKYDVVAGIYINDMYDADNMNRNDYGLDQLTEAFRRIFARKNFYKNVLAVKSQNSLADFIDQFDMEINSRIMKQYYQIDELTSEMIYAIKYHSAGCLEILKEALENDESMTAESIAQIEYNILPPIIRNSWNQTQSYSK